MPKFKQLRVTVSFDIVVPSSTVDVLDPFSTAVSQAIDELQKSHNFCTGDVRITTVEAKTDD